MARPSVAATAAIFDLAEGILWDDRADLVRWVDIWVGRVLSGRLESREIVDIETIEIGQTAGAVALADDGGLLVAAARGLATISPRGGISFGPDLLGERENVRMNDGSVDPFGRFVVGTLALGAATGDEVLLRVDPDGAVETLRDGIRLSNGIAFSPGGDTIYHADTLAGTISRHSYGPGAFDHEEPWTVVLDDLPFHPDGLTVSTDGNLWVAQWGGSSVRRHAPTGELRDIVMVDATQASCPAFVGPRLDILAITSAQEGLGSWTDQSGAIFFAEVEAAGPPGATVAGEHDRSVLAPTDRGEILMRALVVTAPREAAVIEVPEPVAAPGQLVVDVERVGICGTDVEFYTGEMAYLGLGYAEFPLRLGHEWTGRVSAVGSQVDEHWLGTRVTGDTMLGCGRCEYCVAGHQNVCPDRYEVGIRGGWAGALAEKLVIPSRFAFEIPEHVSLAAAALVEPGGNALRAVRGANIEPGHRVLILGSGTIGLLAAQFAIAEDADVHVGGKREGSLALARSLGVPHTWRLDELEDSASDRFDSVIDCTSIEAMPSLSVRLVKPAGRVVFIGLGESPSLVDTRDIALKDVTAVGVLSASGGLAGTIDAFASGAVVPDSIVSEVIALSEVPSRLEGRRGAGAGPGPKVHVDPRLP